MAEAAFEKMLGPQAADKLLVAGHARKGHVFADDRQIDRRNAGGLYELDEVRLHIQQGDNAISFPAAR